MTQLPKAPFFQYNQKRHCIDLSRTAKDRETTTLLAVVCNSDAEWLVYDSAGMTWNYRHERPPSGFSFVTRLLVYTVYNPIRQFGIIWTQQGTYQFGELRDAYLDAINHDDDILTQFVEENELREKVRACQSFRDLVGTWRWMNTDRTHEESSA